MTYHAQLNKIFFNKKKFQVSMEMESGGGVGMGTHKGPQPTFANSVWQRRTRLERFLLLAITLLFVIVVIVLAITIDKVNT
jgi:hypothetical protein